MKVWSTLSALVAFAAAQTCFIPASVNDYQVCIYPNGTANTVPIAAGDQVPTLATDMNAFWIIMCACLVFCTCLHNHDRNIQPHTCRLNPIMRTHEPS